MIPNLVCVESMCQRSRENLLVGGGQWAVVTVALQYRSRCLLLVGMCDLEAGRAPCGKAHSIFAVALAAILAGQTV